MAHPAQTETPAQSEQTTVSAGERPAAPAGETSGRSGGAHAPRARARRETLAHTGPLLAVLFPMLLVYGLAVLTGWTASTGALIGALVLLFVVTYGVVWGTIHMINLPPEDEEEQDRAAAHG
jgi:hypothetical protein